jgi:hypothetical protein
LRFIRQYPFIMLNNPSLLYKKQALYSINNTSLFNVNQPGVRLKNGNEIAILYNCLGSAEPPAEEWQQLIKMLSACKLTEDDVVCINTAMVSGLSWSSLLQALPVTLIIMFGDLADELSANINVAKYNTYQLNGVRLVRSETLATLTKSPPDKAALWNNCLKPIFAA